MLASKLSLNNYDSIEERKKLRLINSKYIYEVDFNCQYNSQDPLTECDSWSWMVREGYQFDRNSVWISCPNDNIESLRYNIIQKSIKHDELSTNTINNKISSDIVMINHLYPNQNYDTSPLFVSIFIPDSLYSNVVSSDPSYIFKIDYNDLNTNKEIMFANTIYGELCIHNLVIIGYGIETNAEKTRRTND